MVRSEDRPTDDPRRVGLVFRRMMVRPLLRHVRLTVAVVALFDVGANFARARCGGEEDGLIRFRRLR